MPPPSTMTLLRAALFNVYFWVWSTILVVGLTPIAAFLSPHRMRAYARFWMYGVHWGLRVIVGLRHRVEGLENLPPGPCIVASKHQSAWETLFFHTVRVDLVIGLKYELTKIPLFGWYLMRAHNIRIDRGGGTKAMRSLIDGAKQAVAEGNSILIFPEGTRKSPGEAPDYKPGVAALYRQLNVPVVPVALNSGVYWGKRAFLKRAGTITVAFQPAIPAGLARDVFMRELEDRIEGPTRALSGQAPVAPAGEAGSLAK